MVRGSLDHSGLFVLGEAHGVAETASAILTLVRALGVRSLGLEWSFDEVGAVVDGLVETGRLDLDALWAIPDGGDLFARDGRFTAGHVRVLEQLVQSGELTSIVAFDQLDEEPPLQVDREEAMAGQILGQLRPGVPMLVVTGLFHASREPRDGVVPMFVHLERELPGLANGALENPALRVESEFDAVFRLPGATPAIVPGRGD